MARFPTPIPTPAKGKRNEFKLIWKSKGSGTPPGDPPPPAPSSPNPCRREQTRPKGFNLGIPYSAFTQKPFYGLYFVHAAQTYDELISMMIAELSRG